MASFLPVLILLFFAVSVCVVIFVISNVLGPKVSYGSKLSPYECGVAPEGDSHPPMKSRFYLIAVLFLLMDVEAVFFFPWAVVYRESLKSGPDLFWGMAVYLGLMVLALLYIFKKRALETE